MEKNKIDILINSKPKEISALYYSLREPFFVFSKRYGLSSDDISDIYQEAFIALRRRALNGKLNEVNSSLKTYLFGIGKNMIFDRLNETGKQVTLNPELHFEKHQLTEFQIDKQDLTENQLKLNRAFKQLPKSCRELLTLYYSRGLSLNEIVELTDYANNGVVRSHKSRCLKRLKALIKNKNNEE